MSFNGSLPVPTNPSVLPSYNTTSTVYALATTPRIDIMNPTVVKQYKPETRRKKGQFVVASDVLANGINIPSDVQITDAYIYLTSDFAENQFHMYYLTANQKANIRAASVILTNYLRNYPMAIITQWGSCFQIKADVSNQAYSKLTGYVGVPQKILIKFKHYNKTADKDTDSDSDCDSDSS